MIYSVRWQLLLSMVAVILITVGMTAVFANLAANAEINRLQGQEAAVHDERLTKLLADTYLYDGSWLDSQGVLESAATLYGEHLVLTDLQHQVVADSHNSVIGKYLSPTSTSRHKTSVPGVEGPLGTLWFSPGVPAGAPSDSVLGAENSGPSLSLLLILSGLLAVAVAMILTFFVSRRILKPVRLPFRHFGSDTILGQCKGPGPRMRHFCYSICHAGTPRRSRTLHDVPEHSTTFQNTPRRSRTLHDTQTVMIEISIHLDQHLHPPMPQRNDPPPHAAPWAERGSKYPR